MPRLFVSRLRLLCIAWSAFAVPMAIRADSIQFGNPYYYAFNFIDYHAPGDPYATSFVNESRSNTTGNLLFASDSGYGSAAARSDTFSLRSTSSADGSYLAPNGWDSISCEGLAQFETDFVVISDRPQVTIDLSYTLSKDLISTDPMTAIFGPGTDSGLHHMTLGVFQGGGRVLGFNSFDAGSYVLSGQLDAGTVYKLRMVINAVSAVKESAGYASAATGLDVALSLNPIPEPGTGLLVIVGMVGLAVRRRRVGL